MKNNKNKKTGENGFMCTNVIDKPTLEILNEKHNALARYIGIPCVVKPAAIVCGAAMDDGSVAHSSGYMCYRIDLRPFKGAFGKIRFRATSNGKDIVFGILMNNQGEVESIAKGDKEGVATVILPLTGNSEVLFATIPAKNGKPVWKDITVELLCNGIISEVNDALNSLLERIVKLERCIGGLVSCKASSVNLALTQF